MLEDSLKFTDAPALPRQQKRRTKNWMLAETRMNSRAHVPFFCMSVFIGLLVCWWCVCERCASLGAKDPTLPPKFRQTHVLSFHGGWRKPGRMDGGGGGGIR